MSLLIKSACAAAMIGGAMLVGAAPAMADEPPPPNCTAGDLAQVMTGVSAATSAYLFSHPDVNAFFTGLKGLPKDQMREQAQTYLDANPQTQAELRGIKQPAADFHNRCGGAPSSAEPMN